MSVSGRGRWRRRGWLCCHGVAPFISPRNGPLAHIFLVGEAEDEPKPTSSAATKPTAETAKVASLYSLMTPNASALGPMIPAMVKKILAVAFVSVVSISFGAAIGHYAFMSLFDWVTSR